MNPLNVLWRKELAVFHVRLGGCSGCGEMADALLGDSHRGTPRIVECDSPRHADLVVVTGFWTEELSQAALTVISQAPAARRLLVVGDCALGRGLLAERLRAADSVVGYLEPDVEIGGCPVTLESLRKGVRDVAR